MKGQKASIDGEQTEQKLYTTIILFNLQNSCQDTR